MDEELEARIRRRAQELWEQDGKPLDKSLSYWLAAEREILGIAPDAQHGADTPKGGTGVPPSQYYDAVARIT